MHFRVKTPTPHPLQTTLCWVKYSSSSSYLTTHGRHGWCWLLPIGALCWLCLLTHTLVGCHSSVDSFLRSLVSSLGHSVATLFMSWSSRLNVSRKQDGGTWDHLHGRVPHQHTGPTSHTQKTRRATRLSHTHTHTHHQFKVAAGIPIECIKWLKYLGQFLLEENNQDWLALQGNLNHARGKEWCRIGRILSTKEKANKPQTMATFYKAIIQSVLLYGSKSCALTKQMMQNQ
jgi:hypothetical protein